MWAEIYRKVAVRYVFGLQTRKSTHPAAPPFREGLCGAQNLDFSPHLLYAKRGRVFMAGVSAVVCWRIPREKSLSWGAEASNFGIERCNPPLFPPALRTVHRQGYMRFLGLLKGAQPVR
jgi:hypothetical protein